MANIWIVLAIVAVLVTSHGTAAKRGCSAFGHSCFGGHGKRSEKSRFDPYISKEVMDNMLVSPDEKAPLAPYPSPNFVNPASNEDTIIPVRGGRPSVWDYRDPTKEELKLKLRGMIKHWLDKYRRSHEQPIVSESEDSTYSD